MSQKPLPPDWDGDNPPLPANSVGERFYRGGKEGDAPYSRDVNGKVLGPNSAEVQEFGYDPRDPWVKKDQEWGR